MPNLFDEVIDEGFHPFLRIDFLNVLRPHGENIDNDIFRDYLDYLEGCEDRFQSFVHLILEEWTWESRKGFFSCLQEHFPDGRWDYVPNHQGGFWGFWWHSLAIEGGKIYLQIEENKLCVKIFVEAGNNCTEMRNAWYEQIQETADDLEVDLTKPKRFGFGWTMTVAV